MRHLLDVGDLDRVEIDRLLDLTDRFVEVGRRSIRTVPALRGRSVASMFFEDSTRTRVSFETAARRLSAEVVGFAAGASSLNKGESLRDTVQTISAMGIDAIVIRHRSPGVPHTIRRWTDAVVINAGDGAHQHPTQSLIDLYTARSHLGALDGLHVGIVGDIRHSRVARSGVDGFTRMGASVTLISPATLLPPSLHGWPVRVTSDLDGVIGDLDICYVLRIQAERMHESLIPTLREYTDRFALNAERAARMRDDALIMHAGPMIRGIEITPEVADLPNAVITQQVANGVAVRQAVLFAALGSDTQLDALERTAT
ncbi:MAG: aspartate carbamoyltransferase catalytic subunit [Microthrixaceae bacterium]